MTLGDERPLSDLIAERVTAVADEVPSTSSLIVRALRFTAMGVTSFTEADRLRMLSIADALDSPPPTQED